MLPMHGPGLVCYVWGSCSEGGASLKGFLQWSDVQNSHVLAACGCDCQNWLQQLHPGTHPLLPWHVPLLLPESKCPAAPALLTVCPSVWLSAGWTDGAPVPGVGGAGKHSSSTRRDRWVHTSLSRQRSHIAQSNSGLTQRSVLHRGRWLGTQRSHTRPQPPVIEELPCG